MTIFPNKLLESYAKPDSMVFEWGSGDSTLWFAKHCKGVVSIEHNSGYYYGHVNQMPDNVVYKLIGPDLPLDDKTDGTYDEFENYVNAIKMYEHSDVFDIVIIDGRARAACAEMVWKTLCYRQEPPNIFIHDFEVPQIKTRESYDEVKQWFNVEEICDSLALLRVK